MTNSITWAMRDHDRALQMYANPPMANALVALQYNLCCDACLLGRQSLHLDRGWADLGVHLRRPLRPVPPGLGPRLFPQSTPGVAPVPSAPPARAVSPPLSAERPARAP